MSPISSLKKRILSTLLFSTLFLVNGASAAIPTFINYQGFITNTSGVAQSGSATVTVRIYDAPTGGTLLFEENEGTVTITNGYFSVPIGGVGDVNGTTAAAALTDLSFDQTYYVTVEIGAPFSTGEMTLSGGVRSQIGVVPFAVTSYGALTSATSTGLTAAKGKMYFDTLDNQLYVYNGTSWNALGIAGAGITSLNGLTGISQFFAVSTTGSDITITSTGTTHTLNIPNASLTARGVISTGTQTLAGDKTFSGSTTLATTTSSNFFATILNAVTSTFTNTTLTNATSSSLFSSIFNAVTGAISSLTGGSSTFGTVTATSSLASNGTLNVTGQTTLSTASSTGLTATNLYSTNAVLTNATTTFFFALNASTTNATSSYAYITNLVAASSTLADAVLNRSTSTNAYITNLVAASSTLTDAIIATLNATTGTITNLTATNATATNLVTTNSTSTNGFFSSLVATLANIADLVVGNSTTTNAVTTNLTSQNATSSQFAAINASTTNLTFLQGTSTMFTSTNASLTNLSSINATSTNGFFTNLAGTFVNASTLFATNFNGTNANFLNFSATNTSAVNLSANSFSSASISGTFLNVGTGVVNSLSAHQITSGNITATSSLNAGGTFNVTGLTTLATTTTSLLTTTDIFARNISASGTLQVAGNFNLPSRTPGGVTFINQSNNLSQDAASFFWDITNTRLGLGNNTPSFLLHVGSSTIASGVGVARFENLGGTCTVVPSSVGGISCTSDKNLKKDITSWQENASELLSNILVEEYRMKHDDPSSPKQVGFIAQNVEEYLPWLVTTDPISQFKAVSYAGIVPITVRALQEVNAKLGGAYNDVVFWVKELKADKIRTNSICVGEVCLTESDVRRINTMGGAPQVSTEVIPSVVADEPSSASSTDTAPPVGTPENESPDAPVIMGVSSSTLDTLVPVETPVEPELPAEIPTEQASQVSE